MVTEPVIRGMDIDVSFHARALGGDTDFLFGCLVVGFFVFFYADLFADYGKKEAFIIISHFSKFKYVPACVLS